MGKYERQRKFSRRNSPQSQFLNICHMNYEKKKIQKIRTVCNIETTLKGTKLIFTKVNPCMKTRLDRIQRLKRSLTGKRSRQQRAVGTGLWPLRIFAFRFTGRTEHMMDPKMTWNTGLVDCC